MSTNLFNERFDSIKGDDTQVKRGTVVFVNIGLTFSCIPIMQKVMVYIEDGINSGPITMAKRLRALVAENLPLFGFDSGINFTPEALYYEIYGSVDNKIPFAVSRNSPKAKENPHV